MEENIVEKLRKILSKPIDHEHQVVYVMVEIRKLIELIEKKKKGTVEENKDYYSRLSFYCDWVVHAYLDRRMAKAVLFEIERKVKEKNADFFSFLSFEEIQEELVKFLKDFNLPYENIIDREGNNFRQSIYHVLADCPLIMNNPSNGQIEEFRLVENNHNEKNITRYSCNITFKGAGEPFSVIIDENTNIK